MENQTKDNLPIDFWGIGVQKGGTTWLFSNLNKLPEFNFLCIKELHYFDRSPQYLSPSDLAETYLIKRLFNPAWIITVAKRMIYLCIVRRDFKRLKFYWKWYFSNYNDNWYLSLFNGFKGYKGEISPSYSLLDEQDIQRMYRLSPKAKLILLLRNPIDRDWSTYRFTTRNKPDFSFENVSLDAIKDYMDTDGVMLRSNYLRTINNYSKVFPKGQLLICFYDAILNNPKQLLSDIVSFITEGSNTQSDYSELKKRVNKSRSISCPKEIRDYLKKKHYNQIKELADSYGGYFNEWYETTYGETSKNSNKILSPTIQI